MGFLEAFKQRVLLMRISGIPVRADYRWFFVIFLMALITAASIGNEVESGAVSFAFGLFTTLVFFACVLLHELAHAFIARMEGVEVTEIVLHPFGGLARLRHEPETPRAEFRIAIAGPAASFLLAVAFAVLMAIAHSAGENVFAPLFFLLFLFNFLLAVFNLFPGYPLDGGRVLRAYLWRSGRDLNEATILTGRCGQIIAAALIVFGLVIAIGRTDLFTGFWTILVGLFLYDAAKGIIHDVKAAEHIHAGDVMQLPGAVEPEMTVMNFVDHVLPLNRRAVFPVAKERQLYGMLLLADMKSLPREEWQKTKIHEVMRPITPDHFVEMNWSLRRARELMRHNGVGAVCVIDNGGHLVGFLYTSGVKKKL
jgi:Zn-dependent protease/CBS domain-containing protein